MKYNLTRGGNVRTPRSINGVMLKYMLLLALLLILIVEISCYFIVGSTALENARTRLVGAGRHVAVFLDTAENGEDEITEYIREYRQEGINIAVLSPDGKMILPFDDGADGTAVYDTESLKRRLANVEAGGSVVFTENGSLNFAASSAYNGGSYITAAYSLKIINGTTRSLIYYFIIVGILVLLVAALIAYFISQKLSNGLKHISTTAVRFSKGDFDVNFANAEYQELADLSDTLNSVRDEVKKSGEFQRELLANVSHDLKTPLTMIKAYASMIQEISGDDPEKRNKHLQVIIDESDRLTGLVNDVLSVSKVNSRLSEINFKVFNLTEFLYGIINKFDYLQETQDYKFMVDIDQNLYTRADEEKIGQVFYNLLGNSVNYTGADKTVFISLKSNLAGDRIRFSLRDTGNGIAKEDIPEIWNRYYRVKETHLRPVKGTGLGLNIVKKILENHAFDFGVESELGKGSTFWVDFPSVPCEILPEEK